MTPEQERLVLDNIKLAPFIANKLANVSGVSSYYRDELHDEAKLALVRAASTYDPDKCAKFSTYACTVIKNSLVDFGRRTFLTENKPLRMPKFGRAGTEYKRILTNREQRRKYTELHGISSKLDIAAFRRGWLARSGVMF
jgi:DNA-directed RNA polymerase specialized sigma subunit